jgi:hypothetical protein
VKKLLLYAKNSDIIVSFTLNPLRWNHFYYEFYRKSDMDPGLLLDLVLKVGPFRIVIYIDDGSW